EQRTERHELEPAHVEVAEELGGRHEAADVGSPVWNAAEAGVDRNRDVRLQRLPRGVHVTRPQERAVARHPRVSVAMQRIRTLVGTPQLRALPVHADAIEPRRGVEAVALIRPPAVDAEIEDALVMRPVAADAAFRRPPSLRDVAVVAGDAPARLRR